MRCSVESPNPCAAIKTKSGTRGARNLQIVWRLVRDVLDESFHTFALQVDLAVKMPGTFGRCSFQAMVRGERIGLAADAI